MAQKSKKGKGINTRKFILNCVPSTETDNDWTFADAIESEAVHIPFVIPPSKDLREKWWEINDQGSTGACVGFATAFGVLRWHYVKAEKIKKTDIKT